MDIINSLLKTGNKTANINVKNCSLYTLLTATDRKPQKIIKGTNIDIQVMLSVVNIAFLWFFAVFDPSLLTVYINCSFLHLLLNKNDYKMYCCNHRPINRIK